MRTFVSHGGAGDLWSFSPRSQNVVPLTLQCHPYVLWHAILCKACLTCQEFFYPRSGLLLPPRGSAPDIFVPSGHVECCEVTGDTPKCFHRPTQLRESLSLRGACPCRFPAAIGGMREVAWFNAAGKTVWAATQDRVKPDARSKTVRQRRSRSPSTNNERMKASDRRRSSVEPGGMGLWILSAP